MKKNKLLQHQKQKYSIPHGERKFLICCSSGFWWTCWTFRLVWWQWRHKCLQCFQHSLGRQSVCTSCWINKFICNTTTQILLAYKCIRDKAFFCAINFLMGIKKNMNMCRHNLYILIRPIDPALFDEYISNIMPLKMFSWLLIHFI